MWKLVDKLLCRLGVHNWRDGPGAPCISCGAEDDFWK